MKLYAAALREVADRNFAFGFFSRVEWKPRSIFNVFETQRAMFLLPTRVWKVRGNCTLPDVACLLNRLPLVAQGAVQAADADQSCYNKFLHLLQRARFAPVRLQKKCK